MFKLIKSTLKSASKGAYRDPEFQKIVGKFPRFFSFVKKRLTPNERFGLHLTLGIIITLIFIVLFFSIIRNLLDQDSLIQVDLRIINLVQIFRSPFFNNFMLFVTDLGKGQVVFLGAVIAGIILTTLKYWRYLITLIVSILGGEVFVWAIKNIFERPRPSLVNALLPESGYSFPSGHAFVAISFYGLLSCFFYRKIRNRFLKFLAVFLGVILILAIGFSRIYLGVHWPSDVLASYVLGAAWLTVLITAIRTRRKPKDDKIIPDMNRPKLAVLSLVLMGIWIVFIIYSFKANPLPSQAKALESKTVVSSNEIPDKLFSNLPRTSETISGAKMEPISLVIAGSEEKVKQTFEEAGWFPTDPVNPGTVWKLAKDSLLGRSYPRAPGIPSFWNTEPNLFAYEKPTEANLIGQRQHIHFWKTPFVLDSGEPIWFCNAHFDDRITFNSLIPAHSIDPAIDKERERVKDDITKTGSVDSIKEFQIVEPTLNTNQGGDLFFTDGKAYIIYLKS